eukprot:UN05780
MCHDLTLNTIQKIRFKKLIPELNDSKYNIAMNEEIKQQVKSAENIINKTFISLISDLNKRKTELIDELHRTSHLKLNDKTKVKANIQFICNDKILKKTIYNFGAIGDAEMCLKPPIIVAVIKNNEIIDINIKLKDCDDKKINYMELMLEYQKFELCDNEEKTIYKAKLENCGKFIQP